MFFYRVGNFFFRKNIPFIPWFCDLLVRFFHNSAIFSSCSIGAGTKLGYGGIAVVIHKRAVIGHRCMIGSAVTIGGTSGKHGVPIIGDDVYIATGAKILGPIVLGNGCVIGANAVVIKNVPPRCVVAGVPSRIISEDINSADYF